jgi:uncharacterized protein YbjT (DUF2867 family)
VILVTGATGHVGRELVDQLSAAGEQVRAVSRDPARAELPPAVEVVRADLSSGDGLAAALDGVAGVFLFLDATRLPSGATGPAARLVAAAGVERVVALSSASAGGDPANVIAAGHIVAEAALSDAGLSATVLRPGEFMSNALMWAQAVRAGEPVAVPFADVPSAPVDPADIAAVAAVALREPGHAGVTYPISGGELRSPRENLATLGRVLGREIAVVELSEADYVRQMSSVMPAFVVEAVLDLHRQGQQRPADGRLPAVRDVTGRPPRTFEQWATAHASAFGVTASPGSGPRSPG